MKYLLWEWKVFLTSTKNLIIFCLLLIGSLFYVLGVLPQEEPLHQINRAKIEARYADRQQFLDRVDMSRQHGTAVELAINMFPLLQTIDLERMAALDKGDYRAYASSTREYYLYSAPVEKVQLVPKSFYDEDGIFAEKDYQMLALYARIQLDLLVYDKNPVGPEDIEQRRAFQVLQRLVEQKLPFLIFLAVLLLSSDLVVKDRRYTTVLNGIPLTPLRKLLAKALVGISSLFLVFLALLPAFLLLGFQNGFGSFKFQMIGFQVIHRLKKAEMMGLFSEHYFLFVLLWLLLWTILIVGLVLLVSILMRSMYFNLALVGLFFSPLLYLYRFRRVKEFDTYLVTSYLNVGEVVSGKTQYLYNTPLLTNLLGLQVMGLTIVCVYLVIYLIARRPSFRLI